MEEEGGADSEDQFGAAASMEHDVAAEGEAMEEDVASPAAAQPLVAAAVPPGGEGEAAAVGGAVPALGQERQQAAAGDAAEAEPQPESQQLLAAETAGGPAAAAEGGDDDATDADEEAELAQGSGRLSVILPDKAGEAAEGTPVSPAGAAGGSAAAPPAAVVAHSLGCAGSGGGGRESQFFKDTEQPAAEDVCLSGDSDEGPAVDEDFGAAGAEGEGPAAQAGQQLQLGSRDSPAGRQRSPPPQLPPEALEELEQQPAGLWAVDAEEQQQQAPLAEGEGDPAEEMVEGEEEEEEDDSMRRWAQVVGTDENRQSVGNTPGAHGAGVGGSTAFAASTAGGCLAAGRENCSISWVVPLGCWWRATRLGPLSGRTPCPNCVPVPTPAARVLG